MEAGRPRTPSPVTLTYAEMEESRTSDEFKISRLDSAEPLGVGPLDSLMSLAQEIVQASQQNESSSVCKLSSSDIQPSRSGTVARPATPPEGTRGRCRPEAGPPDELELRCLLDGRSDTEPSSSNIRLRCFVANSSIGSWSEAGPRPAATGRADGGRPQACPPASAPLGHAAPTAAPRDLPSCGSVSEMYRAAESIWEAELSVLSHIDDYCSASGLPFEVSATASSSDLGGLTSAFAESPPASPCLRRPPSTREDGFSVSPYPLRGLGPDCQGSQPSQGPSQAIQTSLTPSQSTQTSLGPSQATQPALTAVYVPTPSLGPSRDSQPSPRPSQSSQPSLGPGQSSKPVHVPSHTPLNNLGPSQGSQHSLASNLSQAQGPLSLYRPMPSPQPSLDSNLGASIGSRPSLWASLGSPDSLVSDPSVMTARSLPLRHLPEIVQDPRQTHSEGTSYSPSSGTLGVQTIDSFPLDRQWQLFRYHGLGRGRGQDPQHRLLPSLGLHGSRLRAHEERDPFRSQNDLGAAYVEDLYPQEDKET